MDEPTQEQPNKEEPKKAPLVPPWKMAQRKTNYAEGENVVPVEKKHSHTKWVLITIFLLLVTNALTAAYFINKDGMSSQSGQSSGTSSSGSKSRIKNFFSPFTTDPSAALNQASDTKKRADLAAIGTAVNQYMVEFGPAGFPTKSQCIGTSPGCYDLASLLSPDYLPSFPVDSDIGSDVNTGYSFYWDEGQGFVLEAQGKDGQAIMIVR